MTSTSPHGLSQNQSSPQNDPHRAYARPAKWLLLGCLFLFAGCSPASRSPDSIRQDAAGATAALLRDFKAVVQGVFEGVKEKGPININRASEADLETLPGIDAAAAHRIIESRPYESSVDLMRRHVIAKGEYDRIASKVVAR